MVRLAIRVQAAQAEIVLAELLDLAPGGVEEVSLPDGRVEYAVYGAPGELPALPAVRAAAGSALVEVTSQEIAEDWAQRWRQFHRPLIIDGRLTVRPPWEPPGQTPLDLVIEPGQAFGTGSHPTTRLCLELLLELRPAGPLLDLGCGSGVLAIAAAKLGWAPVRALDNDPVAVAVTRENAAANAAVIDVGRADIRSASPPVAATVTANLLSPLLLEWAARLEGIQSSRPEHVIASGLLTAEADEVSAAFAAGGLLESSRRSLGDWSALLLQRTLR